MSNLKVLSLTTLAVLVSAITADGQSPITTTPQQARAAALRPSSEMMTMPAVAPLFIEGGAFSSVLNLVNELNTPLHAKVAIYSLDGQETATKTIRMTAYSSQRLRVQDILQLSGGSMEIGSIRVTSDHTAGLLSALSLTHRGAATTYFDEELVMPSMEGSRTARGVADHVNSDSPIAAVTSLSNMPQNVTMTCLPENGAKRQRTISVRPNQTLVTQPCSNVDERLFSAFEIESKAFKEQKDSAFGAGIAVSSDGMPGSFAVYGVTPHRDVNNVFFTSINFSDPKSRRGTGIAYVGVPVGTSSLLAEGSYRPDVTLTNFGVKAAMVTVESSVTTDSTPQRSVLAKFALPLGSTKTIDLREISPSDELRNSVLIRTDAVPGDVMSKLVSRGNGLLPTVEMLEKDELKGENAGGHPWNIDPGITSTLLLFNTDSDTRKVTVRFGTSNGPWIKRYALKSMETLSLHIKELIQTHAEDDSGKALNISATSGEVGWQADSSRITGRILEASRDLGMARNFSCNQYIYECSFSLSPSPQLLVGFTTDANLSESPIYDVFTGFGPPSSCSCNNTTNSALTTYNYWASGNSAIASIVSGVNSTTSTWNGAAPGMTAASFQANTQFAGGGGSITCQTSQPVNVQTPDHLWVNTDIQGPILTCASGHVGRMRKITYAIQDIQNNVLSYDVGIDESFASKSNNGNSSCPGNGQIRTVETCTSSAVSLLYAGDATGYFSDYIATGCAAPVNGCGFTFTGQHWNWCSGSGEPGGPAIPQSLANIGTIFATQTGIYVGGFLHITQGTVPPRN